MVLGVLAYAGKAAATCTSGYTPITHTANFGTLSIQRDVPVGTVIGTTTSSGTNGSNIATCDVNGGQMHYLMSYLGGIVASGGIAHTYQTNLPGVGIQIQQISPSIFYDNPATLRNVGQGALVSSSRTLTLVKTGPITPGTLTTGAVGVVRDNNNKVGFIVNLTGGTVNQMACSVLTPTVNVPLGDYFITEFTAIGHTTTAQPINIQLNCNSGARINAAITANVEASQAGTIKLTPGTAVASGVGVQILDKNGVPVTLNQKFIVDTVSVAGQYNFGWTARYIQTVASVTIGQANAIATLSLTYE